MTAPQGSELARLDQQIIRCLAMNVHSKPVCQPGVHDTFDKHVGKLIGGIIAVGLDTTHTYGVSLRSLVQLDDVAFN